MTMTPDAARAVVQREIVRTMQRTRATIEHPTDDDYAAAIVLRLDAVFTRPARRKSVD